MVLASTDLANPIADLWLGKHVPETWMCFTAPGLGAGQCNSNCSTAGCNSRISWILICISWDKMFSSDPSISSVLCAWYCEKMLPKQLHLCFTNKPKAKLNSLFFSVRRDLKDNLVPCCCYGQRHFPLNQVAPNPIRPRALPGMGQPICPK